MEVVMVILFSGLILSLIWLLFELIILDKKISKKLNDYKNKVEMLENDFERISKRLEVLAEYIYDSLLALKKRISLVEKIKNIDLSEFPDKLKADFQNEIFVENTHGVKANIRVKDVLLHSDLHSLPNSRLEKVLKIYEAYCDKLYTIEKYSQKEQPAKRPVGRPRKEK